MFGLERRTHVEEFDMKHVLRSNSCTGMGKVEKK